MILRRGARAPTVACLLLVFVAGACLAGDSPPGERSIYQLRASVIGGAGGRSASANVQGSGTAAQSSPAGVSSAGGKILYAGFLKGVALAPSGVEPILVDQVRDELLRNSPNPFRQATWIAYTVARTAPVELRVYDAAGRCVRTLVDAETGPGMHRAAWNGRDDSGSQLASGIYFYRLSIGAYVSSRKMMLVR